MKSDDRRVDPKLQSLLAELEQGLGSRVRKQAGGGVRGDSGGKRKNNYPIQSNTTLQA